MKTCKAFYHACVVEGQTWNRLIANEFGNKECFEPEDEPLQSLGASCTAQPFGLSHLSFSCICKLYRLHFNRMWKNLAELVPGYILLHTLSYTTRI